MGNENNSTKYKVLEILRNNDSFISGEEIAIQSNVSRVSIWKAVQSLQNAGYSISSSKMGYKLESDIKDSLFPWEFGSGEERFVHFDTVKSTMIEAHKIAEVGKKDSQIEVVVSDTQTNGRGQGTHSWITTKGSLAFTLINRIPYLLSESQRLTMASQIALVKTLGKLTDRKYYVRWPNDIWTKKGKVAGVLDEVNSVGCKVKWLNIGIGVNLNETPVIASSDCVFTSDQNYSRKEVLLTFLDEFRIQEKLARTDSSDLSDEWNTLCFDKNKKVRIDNSKTEYLFKGVNGYGWAKLVSEKTNEKIIVPSGKIKIQK
ncbi:MAG: biotin--[acetyl-CoA-carboxylase] ligase [Treponema sp.]|jgi:BirA family transcriptional regulator, biotin operon repressor / biotin---[acetyl-CoA-carboxylase] ligase|nr:biotin--[acetyl-CoA-carboxylase] ligase [Treponema sp.]